MSRPARILSLLLFLLMLPPAGRAGSATPQSPWFPEPGLMEIGAYYYPEQWPEEQWQRDLSNMARLGFTFTHFAEFSWTLLEPREGEFDFSWLDRAIALAHRAGLKVILCTPTPCPPAWMGERYPEIYLVGPEGRRREHGTRGNASLTSPRFLAFSDRVVEKLAQRYGRDPRVWGWQIDNEPPATPDYGPEARRAFQEWLRARYETVGRLNQAWAGTFWSTAYDSFAQVLIPNPILNGEDRLSPHASLDFMRYTADATASFLDRQARIIRRAAGGGQWITTNYTNVCTGADPRRTRELDFASFTLYPVRGQNDLGGDSFRRGSPHRLAEACAYYRPIGGATGVMELQPGQVNWAPTNPQLQPGAVRMWILHAFAGGCSFVCTYRYRHPLRGPEMYHDGIVGTDGVTLMRGGSEFVQAIADLRRLRRHYRPGAAAPAAVRARRTALLWSHDNFWDLEIQPQSASWNTWRHRSLYAAAVKSTGAPLDFVGPEDDFASYPFLVAPCWQTITPELLAKFRAYAEEGGHLVFSPRSGQKNEWGHFHEAPLSAPLAGLAGAAVDFFDMLLPEGRGRVSAGGRDHPWRAWADVLQPQPGTETLAAYADQFYAGKAAAVTRRLGRGSVTYIGVESKEGTLERELVRGVYRRAGVAIEDLPAGVYLEWRSGFHVGVNYANTAVSLPVPANATVRVGSLPLAPGECIVWQE